MKQHILIQNATRKPYSSIPPMPNEAFYDNEKGYWVKDGDALVSQKSVYGRMVTKKCDQETGEDQKGE